MLKTIILKTAILANMRGFYGKYFDMFELKIMFKIFLVLKSYLMLYGDRIYKPLLLIFVSSVSLLTLL